MTADEQAALDAWPTLRALLAAGLVEREDAISAAKCAAAGWPDDASSGGRPAYVRQVPEARQ